MKAKFFTLVLALLAITASSFANGKTLDISRKVLTSFTSKFSTASEISWSRTENYVKASFKLEGQFLFAYYMNNGELIGVSRNVTSKQLPLKLQASLKEDFQGTWITDLFEFSTSEQTMYVATVENGGEKIVIKSTSGNGWEIKSRVKKP